MRERADVPPEVFALPGPLIRQVVHFLDAIGRGPGTMCRSGAISATVANRPGYFPAGTDVVVAYPPTRLEGLHRRRGRYLFTVSRLDHPKRIDLLIRAMSHVKADIELRIAGTGPQEHELRDLAAGDPRVKLMGFLNDAELARAYAGARAVLFVPYQEDYGFITVEAMLSGKPVITTTDAGGPTELISNLVHGLVTAPKPASLGRAITLLARQPWLRVVAGSKRPHPAPAGSPGTGSYPACSTGSDGHLIPAIRSSSSRSVAPGALERMVLGQATRPPGERGHALRPGGRTPVSSDWPRPSRQVRPTPRRPDTAFRQES